MWRRLYTGRCNRSIVVGKVWVVLSRVLDWRTGFVGSLEAVVVVAAAAAAAVVAVGGLQVLSHPRVHPGLDKRSLNPVLVSSSSTDC